MADHLSDSATQNVPPTDPIGKLTSTKDPISDPSASTSEQENPPSSKKTKCNEKDGIISTESENEHPCDPKTSVNVEARLCDQLTHTDAGGSAQWLHELSAKQRDDIDRQVQAEQSLVTEKLPVDVIRREYAGGDVDAKFVQKAEYLTTNYTAIRRVRGDGSCFYRALAFAAFELVSSGTVDGNKFRERIRGFRDRFTAVGFSDIVAEFADEFESLLNEVVDKKAGEDRLLEQLNTDQYSNTYVYFLRLCTSCYLKENRADYEPFLEEYDSIDSFCASEVEPIGRECDHLVIAALTKALDIPLRIEYMDRTEVAGGACAHHDFQGDTEPEKSDRPHLATFLYRPGHYDILYPVV